MKPTHAAAQANCQHILRHYDPKTRMPATAGAAVTRMSSHVIV